METKASKDETRKLLAKEIIDYRGAANAKLEKLVEADIIKPHEKETLVEAAINIETYLKNKDEKVSETKAKEYFDRFAVVCC